MYITSARFSFKSHDDKNNFINILRGEDGLNVTRAWKGCYSIKVFEEQEKTSEIFILGEWEDKEAHESYMDMRKETGLFAAVVSTLNGGEQGLEIKSYSDIGI